MNNKEHGSKASIQEEEQAKANKKRWQEQEKRELAEFERLGQKYQQLNWEDFAQTWGAHRLHNFNRNHSGFSPLYALVDPQTTEKEEAQKTNYDPYLAKTLYYLIKLNIAILSTKTLDQNSNYLQTTSFKEGEELSKILEQSLWFRELKKIDSSYDLNQLNNIKKQTPEPSNNSDKKNQVKKADPTSFQNIDVDLQDFTKMYGSYSLLSTELQKCYPFFKNIVDHLETLELELTAFRRLGSDQGAKHLNNQLMQFPWFRELKQSNPAYNYTNYYYK